MKTEKNQTCSIQTVIIVSLKHSSPGGFRDVAQSGETCI